MLILWLQALHVIFMVTWFAGLFYLPRLFVYHAMSNAAVLPSTGSGSGNISDAISNERFKLMEWRLFYQITTPGAILTIFFGGWLLYEYAWAAYINTGWLQTKLILMVILILYHIYCGKLLADFAHDRNKYSHVYYRFFNEFPTLILIATIILVRVKPSFTLFSLS